jgi:multiple sugar transport system ATP-binding protein
MASVNVREIAKSFGETSVLKGVSLDIADGEFLTLLGPSGCGKSTLLRIIAGLEVQSSGSILIGQRPVDTLRPRQRDVAMVFQSYALYPYMTVAQNMALPLRMRRLSNWQRFPLFGRFMPGTGETTKKIESDVADVARALDIETLLDRRPAQLSGGQQQRVAVGRAMVRDPQVFLMDEPLSNLDAKLRVQMRFEISELHRRIGATFIYVTHDQTEAMTMSDKVAVMMGGEILQAAPPRTIYNDPADLRVATFIGSQAFNRLAGTIRGPDGVEVCGTVLPIRSDVPAGTSVTVGLRPEIFALVKRPGTGVLSGTVRAVEHLGHDLYAHLDLPGHDVPLIARFADRDDVTFDRGSSIHLKPSANATFLFDREGRRLRTAMVRQGSLEAVSG